MIKAAVLGSPISHSLSPILHKCAYQELGVEGDYRAIEVTSVDLNAFLSVAKGSGWSGFSLTMPLKETVFGVDLAIQFDDVSTAIRSANTIFDIQDLPQATSTDFSAFQRLLTPLVDSQSRIAILGGGGTARAALGAIAPKAPEVAIYLRGGGDSLRAAELRTLFPELNIEFREFGSDLAGAEIVLNTTPAGSADRYANSALGNSKMLFESLYNPWPTALAHTAMELGLHVLSGKDLLIEQALDQISLMTGKTFDFKEMREKLSAVI